MHEPVHDLNANNIVKLHLMGQNITAGQLVGHWACKAGRYACDWLLREDGSFMANVTEKGVTVSRQSGRWRIEDGQLVTFDIFDEFDMIASPEDSDTLLEVREQFFVLRTRQGTSRRYKRVHGSKTPPA